MNATKRLYLALLILVSFIALQTHGEIHHSDFETIGNTPYRSDDGWRFTNAEKKIPYDFNIVDKNNAIIPETTCMNILSGGTVTYSGKNGLKWISLNYSSVENGDPVQFKIEITQNEAIVYEKQYFGPTGGFLSEEDGTSPIAQTVTFECEEAIVGDYQLCITNNNPKSNKYVAVVFWEFTWEDDEATLTPDDDNLQWSQLPGTYRNGTAIMVNGTSGSSLKLYNSDTLLGEVPGNNGVIPTIAYHLADNSTCHLKAVADCLGEQIISFHTYTASADGTMPGLSLSLPEGLYNPGTPLYATGVPGEELLISCSGSQSGNLGTYPIPSDSGKAPCEEIYLPGAKDETVTLTLSADGVPAETFQYTLSHTWIPFDSSSAIDFQRAENLYSGSEPVAKPTEGSDIDISGQHISTSAEGVLWIMFESARLVYDSGRSKYYVSADAGSTMTVGTDYRPGEVVISFNKISIIQQENSCCLSPGTFRSDLPDNTHVWQASSAAPALYAGNTQINHSVTFTATSPVTVYGLETAHTIITGSSDAVADPAADIKAEYYDIHGRRLLQMSASGLYIVRHGNATKLIIK